MVSKLHARTSSIVIFRSYCRRILIIELFASFLKQDKEFSILLANRSAALYHMERYDLALQDIELAEENYPPKMMHKLKERTARCYLAKKSYEKALEAFKYVFAPVFKSHSVCKSIDGALLN